MATKTKALKKAKLRHAEYYDFQAVQDKLYQDSLNGREFKHLVEIITRPENIQLAYRNIKSNHGSRIICMIGLFVGSIFGIFFSNEPGESGKTINTVIAEINTEYTADIDGIIAANTYDLLDISGAWAAWKQVLAVYTVKTVTDPDNHVEVATMDDEKSVILRSIFWDMNTITHTLDTIDVEEDVIGGDGLPTGETTIVTKTMLSITVTHKTPDEMAAHYGFTDEQREWLEELLKPEYHNLWNALLYGITSVGDGSMLEIADTQIGNIGSLSYWSWHGFDSRVEWCAISLS